MRTLAARFLRMLTSAMLTGTVLAGTVFAALALAVAGCEAGAPATDYRQEVLQERVQRDMDMGRKAACSPGPPAPRSGG